MSLPSGYELAWFLSGMWAAIFILRAGRVSQSGFFAVMASLVIAAVPALGLLFQDQLALIAASLSQALRSR
jgi:hypothetical protein